MIVKGALAPEKDAIVTSRAKLESFHFSVMVAMIKEPETKTLSF
jgi:hypothetical protein